MVSSIDLSKMFNWGWPLLNRVQEFLEEQFRFIINGDKENSKLKIFKTKQKGMTEHKETNKKPGIARGCFNKGQ